MASLFNRVTPSTAQSNSLFGSTAPAQGSSLFGNNQQQTQQPSQTNSIFGPQKPANALFGASAQNQPPNFSLFGSGEQNQQPQTNSLFSNTSQNQQNTNSLFGQPKQQTNSLFATPGQQQQQSQTNSLFSASNNQQQNTQQQQQQTQLGSVFGQSQSRIWKEPNVQIRQKSVPEQISTLFRKWNPESSSTSFKAHLYNSVPYSSDRAFFTPHPADDEESWEAALKAAPNSSVVPILVTGFKSLGHRLILQQTSITVLQGRLHEINNGLTDLLRRHDLEVAPRSEECRRRHARLARRTMELAGKVQVLRNRGYALDQGEEGLRSKLVELEKKVMNPQLGGRREEVWARMVMCRERARVLEGEVERVRGEARAVAGADAGEGEGKEGVVDEETLGRVRKILEDYDSQITHLNKEVEAIKKDFEEWEGPKKEANGKAR